MAVASEGKTMRTIPTREELLEIVAEYRRNPGVSSRLLDTVATNVEEIVRREMAQGAIADAAALQRLRGLLGVTSSSADELEAQLALCVRAGAMTTATPGLLEHLWQSALAEIAIDQPNYATYLHLRAQE